MVDSLFGFVIYPAIFASVIRSLGVPLVPGYVQKYRRSSGNLGSDETANVE